MPLNPSPFPQHTCTLLLYFKVLILWELLVEQLSAKLGYFLNHANVLSHKTLVHFKVNIVHEGIFFVILLVRLLSHFDH
uniref:Uncharacterized protein n=1 Tax=Arundo donax TaxID=35708 RepID=A0A0A8YXL9_ARUDO